MHIIYIHGGNTFPSLEEYLEDLRNKNYDPFKVREHWSNWICSQLPSSYQMFLPTMPNAWNANYEAWKIWFEKHLPYTEKEVILIGHSL